MGNSNKKNMSLGEWLVNEGFDIVGITEASASPEHTERYRQWLERLQYGTMDYLVRHLPSKYNPALILKDCQSLLMVGLNYYQPYDTFMRPGYGRVALYAWGRDYHKVLKRKLKQLVVRLQAINPEAVFLTGVDATPLSENHYAELAGLGWQGKNTLIINERYGSWFVIGEILSTVPVSKLREQLGGGIVKNKGMNNAAPGQQVIQTAAGCPAGCTLCQKACPTKALYAPYQLDATRCISYLTIENKKEIAPEDWSGLQDWVFGCDLCQRACPFNRHGVLTKEQDFLQNRSGELLELTRLLNIKNTTEYQQLFAGSPLMRTGRSRLLRNAIIVAANTKANKVRPLIKQLYNDEDPLISWHARQAEHFF